MPMEIEAAVSTDELPNTQTTTSESPDDEAPDDDVFAALDDAGEDDDSGDPEVAAVADDRVPSSPLGAGQGLGSAAPDPLLPDATLLQAYALPFAPRLDLQPRPYQVAAVAAWLRRERRGVVVRPTG